MVRRFVALMLVLSLALPACGMAKAPINSVQALQSQGDTFCTAFSINEQEGYWATAAHCATYALEEQLNVTIMGKPAHIVYVGFPSADVAVFQSEATAPAVRLADQTVEVGDELYIVGYPWGITRTKTQGYMAALRIPIVHPTTGYYMTSDLLDITTAGGNSGSPVFNSKGDVIGVLWGGFNAAPVALGVPLEAVRVAIGGYCG